MKISVLIPVFNGMPYIREAVESVLNQNFDSWEMVVSDNGSTDDTKNYLRSLNDIRIRIYEQPINLGIMGNLNFLLEQAHAPIAKILGHDDMMLPGSLGRITGFMEEKQDCAVSRCWASGDAIRYAKGGHLEWEGLLPPQLDANASELAFATFGNLVGNICRAACRPRMVLQAGGFNQEYPAAGDYEGWLRVVRLFGIHFQNEELVFERTHELQHSNTQNSNNEIYLQLNKILQMIALKSDPSMCKVLKHHWTIHFLSPRVPRFVRQVFAGKFALALSSWKNLPLNISVLACIAAYPVFKLKLSQANTSTSYLLKQIEKINKC